MKNINTPRPLLCTKNITQIRVCEERSRFSIYCNIMSYMWLRYNFDFKGTYSQFKSYGVFFKHGDGMQGIPNEYDTTDVPYPSTFYFRKIERNLVKCV